MVTLPSCFSCGAMAACMAPSYDAIGRPNGGYYPYDSYSRRACSAPPHPTDFRRIFLPVLATSFLGCLRSSSGGYPTGGVICLMSIPRFLSSIAL